MTNPVAGIFVQFLDGKIRNLHLSFVNFSYAYNFTPISCDFHYTGSFGGAGAAGVGSE